MEHIVYVGVYGAYSLCRSIVVYTPYTYFSKYSIFQPLGCDIRFKLAYHKVS